MFFQKKTTPSTTDYSENMKRLKREIETADAIVVGAGAGLSASAGLTYCGERFEKNFADFIGRYHYKDMYSATFYPYQSLEEYWGYMSRHIYFNRYMETQEAVHRDLLRLVQGKDYFVITTNVDHCFQKAGFDKKRLFYTQGDYGLWQCSKACHRETYDNKETVIQMVDAQENLKIPTKLIPYCPKCGSPMTMNLRCDDTFVEDEGWHIAAARYSDFLRSRKNLRVLYLELGVGGNTPGIIKYPFWQMTAQSQASTYACINLNDAVAPKEIEKRSICINKDIAETVKDLVN